MLKIEFKTPQLINQDGLDAECMFVLANKITFGKNIATIIEKNNAYAFLIKDIKKITIFTL